MHRRCRDVSDERGLRLRRSAISVDRRSRVCILLLLPALPADDRWRSFVGIALNVADVELAGEIKYYEQTSDAGFKTYSGFCPTCGSPVLSKTERFQDRLYLHAATLDDPSVFDPSFTVFEKSAQPWDHADLKLRDDT